MDTFFYAIDSNGNEKWKFSTGGEIHSSPVIGMNGVIFFGSADGYVYALNADGTERWKYQTENNVNSSPAISAKGAIIIGSDDHNLYSIGFAEQGSGETPEVDISANKTTYGADDHVTISVTHLNSGLVSTYFVHFAFCTRIKKPPERGRSRVLSDDEIKLFWAAMNLENVKIDIYRVSKVALKMILLTGQRPGEVCGMTWAEIDEEGAFWDIPAERIKNGEPQRVPLCSMALEVLEQAKIYSGDCPFVFRSSYKPDEAMSRHTLSRAVSRHWSEMGIQEAFTPHDLRRTLRTRLAELGVSDIVAERVLGHKLQEMMAVYNRHAYEVEKRQALSLWERKLRQIVGIEAPQPAKVIEIKRHTG